MWFHPSWALSRNQEGVIPTESIHINEFSWGWGKGEQWHIQCTPNDPQHHLGDVCSHCHSHGPLWIHNSHYSVNVSNEDEGGHYTSQRGGNPRAVCCSYSAPHTENSEVVLLICSMITYPWWQNKSREK